MSRRRPVRSKRKGTADAGPPDFTAEPASDHYRVDDVTLLPATVQEQAASAKGDRPQRVDAVREVRTVPAAVTTSMRSMSGKGMDVLVSTSAVSM